MEQQPGPPVEVERLVAVLERSRAAGHLGPAPVADHISHSLAFAAAVATVAAPDRAVDLGAGGGIPGLVLAQLVWPATAWALVEARRLRAEFLRAAAAELGLERRVVVDDRRAEILGHDPMFRASFDLVTARSFGPPAVAAECAAPLLRVGGKLVVSEPPADREGGEDRWPRAGLALLGLRLAATVQGPPALVVLVQEEPCAGRFPRRPGKPAKAPLF